MSNDLRNISTQAKDILLNRFKFRVTNILLNCRLYLVTVKIKFIIIIKDYYTLWRKHYFKTWLIFLIWVKFMNYYKMIVLFKMHILSIGTNRYNNPGKYLI